MRLDYITGGPAALRLPAPVPSITLRSALAGSRKGLPYMRDLLKLTARSLANRRQTRGWLQLLNSSPMFSELIAHCPRMVHKIYRPYLTNRMSCADRLDVLAAHYRFVLAHGLAPMVARASAAPLVLAGFDGKTGTAYQIDLRAAGTLEREGELVLQLTRAGAIIYSVAFTFSTADGRSAVSIGCLQGSKCEDAVGLIRDATRDLHGLRPKNLMVSLVRHLGHELGCGQLRLVGNANRVVHSAIKKGLVAADYDGLWREIGALECADGDFELACTPLQAPLLEQVASKRRSEVRKRHELCQAVFAAVTARTCVPAPPALAMPARRGQRWAAAPALASAS